MLEITNYIVWFKAMSMEHKKDLIIKLAKYYTTQGMPEMTKVTPN